MRIGKCSEGDKVKIVKTGEIVIVGSKTDMLTAVYKDGFEKKKGNTCGMVKNYVEVDVL